MEKYRFIKQIGSGCYGDVWLVKCSETRQKYVLKRIDLQHASKREQRAAYLEAKLMSTLKHPNIVMYLDSFYNSKGNLFIVMSYCESGDLHTYIRNQNGMHFEEKQIIHWFVQICMALKYLHDQNILHRDLKTSNIFLTRNKLIKVGDLGIAQILSTLKQMATCSVIGTPCYMSPELFTGKLCTQKSDIWALGCCIYEIATLKYAFSAQDIHSLIQKVMKAKVSAVPNIYSPNLLIIIESMLNCDPEKRPCVTELLLNDFVRKYILLFLQDTSLRSKSRNSSTSGKESGSCTSKANSSHSLSQLLNKDIQLAVKKKELEQQPVDNLLTKVPDINGNGDGNDNSQHRHLKIKDSNIASENANHFQEKECNGENTLNIKSHFKEEINKNCKTSPTNSILYSLKVNKHSTTNNNSKQISENSFQILNTLAYTMKNARFKSFKYCENEFLQTKNEPLKGKHFCEIYPPKSAEELFSWSKINSELYGKRMANSAKDNWKSVLEDKSQHMCILPEIKNAENKKCISPKCSEIDLPLLKNSEALYTKNNSEDIEKQCIIQDKHDCNVDRLLLQKIMQCNN